MKNNVRPSFVGVLLWLLFAVVNAISVSAQAFPATQTNPEVCTVAPCSAQYRSVGVYQPYPWVSSPSAACEAQAARMTTNQAPTFKYRMGAASTTTVCVVDQQYLNNAWQISNNSYSIASQVPSPSAPLYSCPSGSSLSGAVCTCTAPSVENPEHTGCVAANYCSLLTGKPHGPMEGEGNSSDKFICDAGNGGAGSNMSGDPAKRGCVVKATPTFSMTTDTGSYWSSGSSIYTGAKCNPDAGGDPSTPDSGSSPSVQCKLGQVSGMVDGKPYCYTPDPGTNGSTEKKLTGSGSQQNQDGTKTTRDVEKTQTCSEGKCTTTTTTTTTTRNVAGQPIGIPVTKTDTATCTQGTPGCGNLGPIGPIKIDRETTTIETKKAPVTNPDGSTTTETKSNTTGLGNSGGSGGGNGNGDGDATDCEIYPDTVGCMRPGNETGSDTINGGSRDVGTFSEIGFGSNSVCPSPIGFTVIGHTYAVSYQPICDRLGLLKVLFLTMAAVVAAYIIADGFKVS